MPCVCKGGGGHGRIGALILPAGRGKRDGERLGVRGNERVPAQGGGFTHVKKEARSPPAGARKKRRGGKRARSPAGGPGWDINTAKWKECNHGPGCPSGEKRKAIRVGNAPEGGKKGEKERGVIGRRRARPPREQTRGVKTIKTERLHPGPFRKSSSPAPASHDQ